MEERSPSIDKGDSAQKQAACLNCRKSKTKCVKEPGEAKCKKCAQTDVECMVPDYRVGRKKGVKNKRDGLEKAVYRVEQAIKKARTQESQSEEDQNTLHLQSLLNEAQGVLPEVLVSDGCTLPANEFLSAQHPGPPVSPVRDPVFPQTASPGDQYSLDDAENPLQLLARASDLSAPSKSALNTIPRPSSGPPSTGIGDQKLRDFFGPFRPSLDVGPEVDPIDLGLVTEDEAAVLFTFFYDNLSHTRWGLDPLLHTPQFVRRQSAFLFTSIMAGSALFIPTAAAVSKRLTSHSKVLVHNLMIKRNRSPEIVLGFMVNIPWMAPGQHWSDDGTCSYMASALTIAMDICLNKLIVPPPSDSLAGIQEGKAPSDCIAARKALELDGFPEVDPTSDLGRRLLRRRERIWLALFVLDRGVCLARGRSFTVPLTKIIERCDNWHKCSIADRWDGSIVSSAVLRRDLAMLITQVKKTCDGNQTYPISGDIIAQSLQEMIDGFFNNWYSSWAFAIGGMKDNSIPPYVEILVTHGRLSIYSSVVNHPTASTEAKGFFRAAGLSSALNVLRAAVQGEDRLKSMPNNTSIMISFAACFAFYLSTVGSTGTMSLTPSIGRLIEESAGVLERIGSTPAHRNGASALYGRHLREVVGASPQVSKSGAQGASHAQTDPVQNSAIQEPAQAYRTQPMSPGISELLNFSAMSDNQINEAIHYAGKEWEIFPPSLRTDDQTALDWLDWFNMDINVRG
ncbi:hypothetical protein B2J93_4577 [Marssonina coronariae]|uniref:Zn(2)-C6 fungal-type domain-containing protein n=1 Tax=Diplocarpon coronariae TaxID=2795749 RepID=A0A218Z1L0_9HELO|nr:hypothetical protein B2J93_4577 [Marssonina coronariae]